ncbi:MAG: hypothetical protein K2M12_05740, partial [Muribaculaceae bacterium]|nr:hypothetical protein [Muribaculaceae bacterium]
MKKLCLLLSSVLYVAVVYAESFSYDFRSVCLSEALTSIAEEHPDLRINFIYNELDKYSATAIIHTDNPGDALRQTVGQNPVSVMKIGNRFYIEALQHGRYAYTGKVTDEHNEPLPGTSVMVLAPQDSAVVTFGTSDKDGLFSVPCDRKNIMIKFSCVGYATKYVDRPDFQVGTVRMQPLTILLSNVAVNADNAILSADKSTYIPNSMQKNAAQSGVMLLGLMAIPQLDVDMASLSVRTNDGQIVALFINYTEACRQDLDGMRMQDVKRVEFYTQPADARFKGARYAINFVMQQYEYGGYTKLKAEKQVCVNRTDALLYSKMAYKSMTYDVYADESYLSDSHSGTEKTELFRFPDLFGKGAAEVARTFRTESSKYRNNINNLALRALYASPRMQLSNRAGLNVASTPVNDSRNSLSYDPRIFDEYQSQQALSSKNITASYAGDFFFNLSANSSLQAAVTYNYGHNTSNSHYASGADFSITNDAVEQLHDLHLNPRFSHRLNVHNRLTAYGSAVWRRNVIDYSGSSASTQKYDVKVLFMGLHYDYIHPQIQAGGEIGWAWENNRISGIRSNENFPQINVYANFHPAQKHLLTLSCNFGKDVPEASQKSPNMLQQDELMWFTGTPDLKDYTYTNNQLTYTWLPGNRWQLSATGALFNFENRCVTIYTPEGPDGTMLRRYVNGGSYRAWMFNINATARLLGGKLILNLVPQYWLYRTSGAYSHSIDDLIGRIQASYYLRGFYFVGVYNMKRKHPATQAEYREKMPEQYQLQA